MYKSLYERIHELFVSTTQTYEGHHGSVAHLIHDCRLAISEQKGGLGPWEREELDSADDAVRHNMLKLALNLAENALDVTRLPAAEYEAGYNYTRRGGEGRG